MNELEKIRASRMKIDSAKSANSEALESQNLNFFKGLLIGIGLGVSIWAAILAILSLVC